MSNPRKFRQSTALLLALSLGFGTTLPFQGSLLQPAAVVAQTNQFPDVSSNYWAAGFINELVNRGVIAGFPDGSFRPDAPVTRAQFAAMVQKALPKSTNRNAIAFGDVPSSYWAFTAINNAYEMGFLSGYPGQVFRPEQNIPREQVLVALANGLNYTPRNDTNTTLGYYRDSGSIADFARSPIAAATERRMVVNYSDLQQLNPKRNATRAEVAAFIYQALLSQNQVQAINSPYIVAQDVVAVDYRINAGTIIPISYKADKILLMRDETAPVTLTVDANIVNNQGVVLIPQGSEIRGEFRPSGNGTRFVAQQLNLPNGQTYSVNATSQVITETESVTRGMELGGLLRNAVLGTGAAAAISAVTGDRAIATEELLIGAGAGILATLIPQFLGLNRVDLLVVETNTDLDLTLNNDLVLRVNP
ncbi:S-layer homology domain-containing protein [Picosynechococcus sp. NKBG15041c]|uniref:S-layer homology domain-containing protein n=1 Tax=Picosynechococcus sp. NKBG15041c TaxID=1407650 RepID=UPI000467B645|nr:S-layer homology domain-containing protein [Picosynechococcus sp. NKBG15041c]